MNRERTASPLFVWQIELMKLGTNGILYMRFDSMTFDYTNKRVELIRKFEN